MAIFRNLEFLDKRTAARLGYKRRTIFERQKFIERAKELSLQIISCFTEQDYREFIGNKENFNVFSFPLYLKRFCDRHEISVYENAAADEACFLEDEAFSTVLDMTEAYLCKNAKTFWEEMVSKELYAHRF